MSTRKKAFNPFYVLVILSGVAFAITACAYGVMTVRQLDRGSVFEQAASVDEFSLFMDNSGPLMLGVEVLALAIFTFLAIGMDQYLADPDEVKPAVMAPTTEKDRAQV